MVYSDNRILVYADIDGSGNIISAEIGSRIIPSRQYDVFLITDDDGILLDTNNYKIIDKNLIKNNDVNAE